MNLNLHRHSTITIAILLLLLLLPTSKACSQNTEKPSWKERIVSYIEGEPFRFDSLLYTHHTSHYLRPSYSRVQDHYLSPIAHGGWGIGFSSLHNGSPLPLHTRLYREIHARVSDLKNPSNYTSMYSVQGEVSIGGIRRVASKNKLAIDAGLLYALRLEGLLKMSNTNNLFNLKASTGIDALVRIIWTPKVGYFRPLFSYSALFGGIHLSYTPEFGQSYYDLVSGENRGKVNLKLTSPINQFYLRQIFTTDLPIHHKTWTLGVEYVVHYQDLSYLKFRKGSWALVLGYSFDSLVLSGGKSHRSSRVRNFYFPKGYQR